MSLLRADVLSRLVQEDLGPLLVPGASADGWPGCTAKQVAAKRLVDALLKKHVDDVAHDADDKALEKFLAVNAKCSSWILSPNRSLVEDVILGETRNAIYRYWYRDGISSLCDNLYDLLDVGRHGPGKSAEVPYEDFYSKSFSGPLSSSSSLLMSLYTRYISARHSWLEAEKLRDQCYGKVTATSYLTFVPKSNEISRTICVEPSVNMFFQQGLKTLMEDRLSYYFGLNLVDQQAKNRELARLGSIDGRLGTIDLSSASDSISREMLRYLLPEQMLKVLDGLRCSTTRLPNGEVIPLHMISTMGNAFTFPLQCVIFASLISAVYKVMDIPWRPMRGSFKIPYPFNGAFTSHNANVGVNGDDLIVDERAYNVVCRMLDLLGFTVNPEKSFNQGHFRESCGADWFAGVPVRGFYLKDQNAPNAPYVAWNQLTIWSAKTGIPLTRTLKYLLRCARKLAVPWHESDSAGFKLAITSIRRPKTDRNGSFIYSRLEPRVRRLVFDDSTESISGPESLRRIWNPSGFLLCSVEGYIKQRVITLRDKDPRWQVRTATTPSDWEYEHQEACEGPQKLALQRARSTD